MVPTIAASCGPLDQPCWPSAQKMGRVVVAPQRPLRGLMFIPSHGRVWTHPKSKSRSTLNSFFSFKSHDLHDTFSFKSSSLGLALVVISRKVPEAAQADWGNIHCNAVLNSSAISATMGASFEDDRSCSTRGHMACFRNTVVKPMP